ncbi:LysR substrate-binding domain-containing protein, partial [Sulfuritalea sp.]|uniref:LysR substrate-binding domain-containing protein n=1 Tax=Sulfuritalea sp. TaxID=2480090 RepID=UPI00286D700F
LDVHPVYSSSSGAKWIPHFREQVLDACPDISHAEGSLHEGHSIETVRCMVASGYGVSVLPAGSLSGIYKNGMVVSIPFEDPAPSRRIALAWRQGYSRPKLIEAIIEAIELIDNPSYRPIPA